MRNIVKVSVAALGLMLGLSSCDSFLPKCREYGMILK